MWLDYLEDKQLQDRENQRNDSVYQAQVMDYIVHDINENKP